jgi:hypothetical protein
MNFLGERIIIKLFSQSRCSRFINEKINELERHMGECMVEECAVNE